MRDLQRGQRLLLHQQNRCPRLGERPNVPGQKLGRPLGRQPGCGLVEQEHFRPAHQRPPHCDHFPLTPGELGRSPTHERTQRRKQASDLVYPGTEFRPRHTVAADLQVLPHGERVEYVVVLRHIAEAKPRQAAGALVRDIGAAEHDLAGPDPEQPGDRLEQRALARAVGADDRDDLTGADLGAHPAHDGGPAVAAHHVLQRQHDRRAVLPGGVSRRGRHSAPPGVSADLAWSRWQSPRPAPSRSPTPTAARPARVRAPPAAW